jgi:UV DNA damage endonuclease
MPIRHIGYACQNMTLGSIKPSSKRVFTDRTMRMNGFSLAKASQLSLENINDLLKVMRWNADNGIFFFRIGSGLFPFMDHPDLKYALEDLSDSEAIRRAMGEVGETARKNKIRLSMHPGPYTCLASPNESVVEKSLLCIEMHSLIGDLLGVEEFVINIHVGGVYEGKPETAERFCKNFKRLSKATQKRLTIENDDKEGMWTVDGLFYIYKQTAIPIVLDVHHHSLNHNGITLQEAASIAFSTWPTNRVPKIHHSESRAGSRPQAHSDYISNPMPDLESTRPFDVMFEAKAKELAVLKYLKHYVHITR